MALVGSQLSYYEYDKRRDQGWNPVAAARGLGTSQAATSVTGIDVNFRQFGFWAISEARATFSANIYRGEIGFLFSKALRTIIGILDTNP